MAGGVPRPVRPGIVLALAWLCACGDETPPAAATLAGGGASEALLVRVRRDGGPVAVFRPGSDSVLWESREPAPPTDALLGFDEYLGTLTAQDTGGRPFVMSIRVGTVERLGTVPVGTLAAVEGAAVFTTVDDGALLRLTPVATWSWRPPQAPSAVIPLLDGGAVVVATTDGAGSVLRRIRPPAERPVDSLDLPAASMWRRTTAADLLWGVADGDIIAVRVRDLTEVFREEVSGRVRAIETTPSGDRLYVATEGRTLQVVDRFAKTESAAIDLPAPVTALRMDPEGTFLLARAEGADRVFVIAVGTGRIVSTVDASWGEDLPVVTPAATLVVREESDVVERDILTGRERIRHLGGGADLWRLVRWDGFRPRRANLDGRLRAGTVTDTAAADSAFAEMVRARYGIIADTSVDGDSIAPVEPVPEPDASEPPERGDEPEASPPPPVDTWMVGFATLADEAAARRLAAGIRGARIIPASRDGAPAWRVVAGPYPSREAAERAGIASDLPFWVFEAGP